MKTWQEKFNELYELTKTFGYLENEFPSEKNIDDEEKHKVIFKDFIQSEKKLSFLEGRTCKQNEIDHHVQHKLNRQLEAIEKEIQAKRKELGFSVDPRTGEYRWGESPSSVCRDCGQKRKSESQGYNQAIDDIKQIINKYKQNL